MQVEDKILKHSLAPECSFGCIRTEQEVLNKLIFAFVTHVSKSSMLPPMVCFV